MRFFVLGAAISALAAVAAAVPSTEGKLTPDETKHMKESIMSMSKAINTKSCDVAKSQVLCLHNMIQDYSVQGHVTGERVSTIEPSLSMESVTMSLTRIVPPN